MNYLTLEELKKQVVVDTDFTDDDDLLEALGDTAEEMVEKQIDTKLSEVVSNNDGNLPNPLKHAMKMLVEYLYDNRGSNDNQIPDAFFYMCALYRSHK